MFHRQSVSNRSEKTEVLKNKLKKPVYLELSKLELSKILMYDFWYDYVKPQYDKKAKLLYGHRQFHCINKKQMISIKTFQKMLKLNLILQVMN